MSESAVLLVHCPDQKGIVASISGFLYSHGANILHADQHQDNSNSTNQFFMRVEWDLVDFDLDETRFNEEFQPLATSYEMQWELAFSANRPAVAIFVSQYQHCLLDLLYRHKAGELPCRISIIISNHMTAIDLAQFYGVSFQYVRTDRENKEQAEQAQLALLEQHKVDLVVLARYMQILSPEFVARYPRRIINVHHSFLPAFIGSRPYQAAHHRGVKLIGATSHYVTETLDEGPIIEQDVARVSHRDQVRDLVQRGADLERSVLSRATRWHLEHRILQYSGKTVIFD